MQNFRNSYKRLFDIEVTNHSDNYPKKQRTEDNSSITDTELYEIKENCIDKISLNIILALVNYASASTYENNTKSIISFLNRNIHKIQEDLEPIIISIIEISYSFDTNTCVVNVTNNFLLKRSKWEPILDRIIYDYETQKATLDYEEFLLTYTSHENNLDFENWSEVKNIVSYWNLSNSDGEKWKKIMYIKIDIEDPKLANYVKVFYDHMIEKLIQMKTSCDLNDFYRIPMTKYTLLSFEKTCNSIIKISLNQWTTNILLKNIILQFLNIICTDSRNMWQSLNDLNGKYFDCIKMGANPTHIFI